MKSFESVLLRLKAELKIQTDKEVGALLGLQEKAFNARKRRDSFPEDKLRALAQQHPDLNIDVDYVLTGVSPDLGKTMAAYSGSPEGRQLRACLTLGGPPGQALERAEIDASNLAMGNPPDGPTATNAFSSGGIDEAVVHQAVIDAVDLLSLDAKIDAQQLAKAVVKLCLRKAG